MGYFKLYASKDAYIDKAKPTLNYGGDSIVVMSLTAMDDDLIPTTFTRGLFQFDITSNQLAALSSSYTAILNIENARNGLFTDSEYYLELYPITEQWTEGQGTSLYGVTGAVSYIQRTNSANWSVSGGSFTASPSASVFFKGGTESLTANLGAFMEYWKTQPNYGIMVKFPALLESTTSIDYANNKMFFSKNSPTLFKPFIDVTYDTPIKKDDRNNLHIGTNTFFYTDRNVSSSAYTGKAYIKNDITSTAQTQYTMSYYGPYTWYITVPNSTMNWVEYFMVVSNTAASYSITSSITGHSFDAGFFDVSTNTVESNIRMKENYTVAETTTVRASIYNFLGKQMGTYSVDYYPQNVYLFFIEKNSRSIVTPELEMGYDIDGWFLRFDMGNLSPGFSYIPVLKIVDFGNVTYKAMEEAKFYVNRTV